MRLKVLIVGNNITEEQKVTIVKTIKYIESTKLKNKKEPDILSSIVWEDMVCQTMSWTLVTHKHSVGYILAIGTKALEKISDKLEAAAVFTVPEMKDWPAFKESILSRFESLLISYNNRVVEKQILADQTGILAYDNYDKLDLDKLSKFIGIFLSNQRPFIVSLDDEKCILIDASKRLKEPDKTLKTIILSGTPEDDKDFLAIAKSSGYENLYPITVKDFCDIISPIIKAGKNKKILVVVENDQS